MPRKIPLQTKRQWLSAYERGEPEASIAKKSQCQVRTVKKGIDDARRERDGMLARAELAKEALRRHQEGLLGAVGDILTGAGIPPRDWFSIQRTEKGELARVMLPGVTVEIQQDGASAAKIVFYAEGNVHWDLLREHLKRDPLWKRLLEWKRDLAAYVMARIVAQERAVALLVKETGYEMADSLGNAPSLNRTNAYLLSDVAISYDLQESGRHLPDNDIIADTTGGWVRWGGAIVAEASGNEQKCKRDIMGALQTLRQSEEMVRARKSYENLQRFSAKARQTLEEIVLLGLVPGQCRICRQLGI